MDSFDLRVAHSSEASTDELASFPSPEPPPAACLPAQADALDRGFATAAEQEAYWIGVRVGAEAVRAGLPTSRHLPAELDFELTRDADLPCLVSTPADRPRRTAGQGASPRRVDPGQGTDLPPHPRRDRGCRG